MILLTIANTTTPGSSAPERTDGGSSIGATTDASNEPGSFSSAMANAAAAPAPNDAPNCEAPTAPQMPGAQSTQSAAPSGTSAKAPAQAPEAKAPGNNETVAPDAAPRKAACAARGLTAGGAQAPRGPAVDPTAPNSSRAASGKGSAGDTAVAKEPAETSPKVDTAVSASTPSQPAANASADTSGAAAPAQTTAGASDIDATASLVLAQNTMADSGLTNAGARAPIPVQTAPGASGARGTPSAQAPLSKEVAPSSAEQESVATDGARSASDATVHGGAELSFSTLLAPAAKAMGPILGSTDLSATADTTAASTGAGTQLPPAALAALGASAQGAGTNGAASVLLHVSTPVGEPGFGADVSRQMVYLTKVGAHSAELSLQPAELGPVNVSIRMNGLEASLVISASHPATRAALQEALPHLSELFQSSGLQLTGAQVGDGSQNDAGEGYSQRNAVPGQAPLPPSPAPQSTPIVLAGAGGTAALSHRLIDTFA